MKKYLFATIAAFAGTLFLTLGLNSCGTDNPLLGVDEVEVADLTSPLFMAYDNTLDKNTKLFWAFTQTEAAKGSITVKGDTLTIKTDWFFNSWKLSSRKLYLGDEGRSYDLKIVSVLSYQAITFGGTYVCIPSSNKTIDGVNLEERWYSKGLTRQLFWDAIHKSYDDKAGVDIKLSK